MAYTQSLLDSLIGTYRLAYEQNHPIALYILEFFADAGIIPEPTEEQRRKLLTPPDNSLQYKRGDNTDADDEKGEWITVNGTHIHLNEGGNPDKGPQKVLGAMKSGAKEQSKAESGKKKSGKVSRPPSGTKAAENHICVGKSEKVQKIYDEIRAKEPKITDDLYELTQSIGCELEGLEHSVKTGPSVADKIDRKRKEKRLGPQVTDEQIVSSFADVIRYTAMGSHDELAHRTKDIINGLEKAGYKIPKVENKYLIKDTDYKGINLDVVSPTGQRFELQVHSKESLAVKNVNHKLYNESRKVGTPKERKEELENQMRKNAAKLPQPKEIETLKNRG